MTKTRVFLASLAGLVALLAGGVAVSSPPALTSPAPATGAAAQALTVLDGIPVKGRAPLTGYTRAQFGPAWLDVDNNRCDTRNDILAAQLTNVIKDGACKVISGTLHDPYTGRDIPFTRATCKAGDTSSCSLAVQIDHVVPLGDAWQTGAQSLALSDRERFANDPVNLQATDGPTNAAKGDGDAATWLPPVVAYRCTYVERQVATKARYNLWVTPAEHDAIKTILGGCS